MIKPTVGRVVWYWHSTTYQSQPYCAQIVFVIDDNTVNLSVTDHCGKQTPKMHVQLFHGEPGQIRPKENFCEWMPFQLGQASKTEQMQQIIEKDKA